MPRGRSRAGGALGRDHRGDASPAQGEPNAATAVGLITDQLGRPQARPPPADAPDRAAADQGADLLGVVNLATGQCEGDWLAVALAAQVDLGREAATRAAQRLVLGAGFAAGFARPGGMLVSAHDRAVQEVQLPADPPLGIGQGLQRLQHVLPYARPAPAVEPARHRAHPTIVPRQVAPGRTAVEDPENAVEDPAVVIIRPPGPRLLRRQQRFQTRPLRVAQFVTSLRWHANNMAPQTTSSTKRSLQTRPRSATLSVSALRVSRRLPALLPVPGRRDGQPARGPGTASECS